MALLRPVLDLLIRTAEPRSSVSMVEIDSVCQLEEAAGDLQYYGRGHIQAVKRANTTFYGL